MKRPLAVLLVLVVAHVAGIHAMARWRLMESLLAPNARLPVAAAIGFLLARFALVFLGPGLVILAARELFRKRAARFHEEAPSS